MTEPDPSGSERRKRLWMALGGTLVFSLAGLLLAPGVARREPAVAPPAARDVWRESAAPVSPPTSSPSNVPAGTPDDAKAGSPPDTFDCVIQPNELIEVRSAITGRIEEILVERSDSVKAGQIVARLESSVERAAVEVARARAERSDEVESSRVSLALGEKRRARAQELFENNSLSLDTREQVEAEATLAGLKLEQARENHRLALLQLDEAKAALERRTIRSPVSGIVVERLMAPGEVVDDETILRIAEVDPLRVGVILPSSLFGRLRPGDGAQIVPEPPLDQVRSAEVEIVDRVIDGASGTFGVHLRLANPDHELPAGLRCQVRFAKAP